MTRAPRISSEPFVLEARQEIPVPLDRVFAFFERPENLEALTPPLLHFHILTARPIEMKVGALIDYRLTIRGLPVRWRTEIIEYDPPHRFVDVQLKGPYRLWHHTHTFERIPAARELPERTLIRDRVRYLLPRIALGPLASAVNSAIVRPDLDRIFAYRARRVTELLAPSADPASPRDHVVGAPARAPVAPRTMGPRAVID